MVQTADRADLPEISPATFLCSTENYGSEDSSSFSPPPDISVDPAEVLLAVKQTLINAETDDPPRCNEFSTQELLDQQGKEAAAKEAAKAAAAKEAAAKEAAKAAAAKEVAAKEAVAKEVALREAAVKEAGAKKEATKEAAGKSGVLEQMVLSKTALRGCEENRDTVSVSPTASDEVGDVRREELLDNSKKLRRRQVSERLIGSDESDVKFTIKQYIDYQKKGSSQRSPLRASSGSIGAETNASSLSESNGSSGKHVHTGRFQGTTAKHSWISQWGNAIYMVGTGNFIPERFIDGSHSQPVSAYFPIQTAIPASTHPISTHQGRSSGQGSDRAGDEEKLDWETNESLQVTRFAEIFSRWAEMMDEDDKANEWGTDLATNYI